MNIKTRKRGTRGKNSSPSVRNGSKPLDHHDGSVENTTDRKLCGWRTSLVPQARLPKFLRDNEYLLHYHRPQMNSFVECLKSMFRLHTETWNIWTHLGGSLFFLLLTIYYLTRPGGEISLTQKLTFLVFFLGAILCMGCSGFYHAFICHSEPVYRFCSKLDYCGVILLIVASWAPWLQYGFYCSTVSKLVYSVLVGGLGFFCVAMVIHDKFGTPTYRPIRAAVFVAFGLMGVVPGIHYATVYGVNGEIHMFCWLIIMAVLYILGAIIYACRIPERLYPGKFDIWFQSHQIMHLCVVAGALTCYRGASMLADHRISGQFDCTDSIPGAEMLGNFQ